MTLSLFGSVIKSYRISYTEKLTEWPTAATIKNDNIGAKRLSSYRATVTDDVSKLGYTSVIFLNLGVKVDETYYCDLLLSQ